MYGYSVMVAQYIEGKRKSMGDGYYFIQDNDCYVTKEKPEGKVIGINELESIIYEGFRNLLINFINSENNKEVYYLVLQTSEHNDLIMYIDNEESFKFMLENKYTNYNSEEDIKILRTSIGDCAFMLYCEDGLKDESLEIMKLFNAINYFINVSDKLYLDSIKDYEYYFEAVLFDNALYSMIERVFNRLKVEFVNLDKTDKFISYPSCGDDYIDDCILVRRHCDEKLFYEFFFKMKKEDQIFSEYVKSISGLSNKKLFEVLSEECIENTHRTYDIFSRTGRNEYAAVKILEERLAVDECLEILKDLIIEANLRESEEINTKIFLIGCTLINKSSEQKIEIDEIIKCLANLNYQNEEVNEIIDYFKRI